MSRLAILLVASLSGSLPLTAQVITPAVSFSVHDQPIDGLGDSFNAVPFEGLIRTQSTRADRAMQEFDVAALAGQQIASAVLSGRVSVNNAFDNGPRNFDFLLYVGNGQADLSDYEIDAVVIGMGNYWPPNQSSFTYSFDVTSRVQSMLDCGVGFIGLKVVGTSNPNFPNVLDATISQLAITTGAPEPTWTDLGFATPGTNGAPQLVGSGTLTPGNPTRVTLCNALPNSPAALFIGFGRIDFPILGATLVPFPDLVAAVPTDPLGMRTLTLTYPPPSGGGVPLFFQYWVIDPGAPQGVAVSNALTATAP